MNYLCAFLVNSIPVNEMDYFTPEDLDGNDPYKIAESVPTGYQDISSVQNWWNFFEWKWICKDYKFVRNEIIIYTYVNGWSSLTSAEKDISASIFAVGSTERSERYSIEEQVGLGLTHHLRSVECRKNRLMCVQLELFNRLQKSEWENIFNITSAVTKAYLEIGQEGTLEGDPEGLFDFVESRTGTSYYNNGLVELGYTPTGLTMVEFRDRIMDFLKTGSCFTWHQE